MFLVSTNSKLYSHQGGGGQKKSDYSIQAYGVVFAGNPRRGGGGTKLFSLHNVQNFHETRRFQGEWLVDHIENKRDK